MKQRFTVLDVRAISNELNSRLSNTFIQNFYSFQQRFIYLKLSNKDVLLIEPGARMHLCQSHDMEISHFCKKLREKCRHARIHRIYQYGYDRIVVIDIQRCRLVVELFSGGNIVIIDEDDVIVDLLRPVKELGIVKGSKYIFNYVDLEASFDRFRELSLSEMFPFEKEYVELIQQDMVQKLGASVEELKREEHRAAVEEYLHIHKFRIETLGGFGEVTLSKGKPDMLYCFETVSDALKVPTKHPAVLETLASMSLTPTYSINLCNREEVEKMLETRREAKALHFTSFSEASEFYFADKKKQKKSKEDKGTRIKRAQEKYIQELAAQAEGSQEVANVLSQNKSFVGAILDIFRNVFETRMEWKDFEAFWEQEKLDGNPHAMAIVGFDLKERSCIVELDGHHIELDLRLGVDRNIERYYQKKKKAIDKSVKTQAAIENIVEKLIPKKESVQIQKREPFWFEKFHFFISSESELVIGGRNAQQNEIIVKRHLDDTDLYFHCDVQGASSVVCKGRGEATISEASYMSLCMSKCWEEGVIRPVFYVEPSQVSKTAPSGEFVPKGGFMIKGKKNILNPYRLEYGVGILFKIEGASDILDFCTHPKPEDRIAFAMPVGAPWSLVRDYRYRVRLCPGNEKKSKICQDILKRFNDAALGSAEERAVRAIGVDEYMSVVLGKSKIAKIIK